MADRRSVDELTIEELEQVLMIRRRAARAERLRRLAAQGRVADPLLPLPDEVAEVPTLSPFPQPAGNAIESGRFRSISVEPLDGRRTAKERPPAPERKRWSWRKVRDRGLLLLEVTALIGLVAVLVASVSSLRELNQEVAQARDTPPPTSTPMIQVSMLPGSSFPPGSTSHVPEPYRNRVQPVTPIAIPTPGPQSATRIVIPAINVDMPVVEGDGWEELKKGVGRHINSANPGERGNMVLSGHNDVFGEVFRYLENLDLEDEIIVYAGVQPYHYRVKAKRIVEPTDVSVMAPTSEPSLTLITCYPYLVDTHRLVVIAQLAE